MCLCLFVFVVSLSLSLEGWKAESRNTLTELDSVTGASLSLSLEGFEYLDGAGLSNWSVMFEPEDFWIWFSLGLKCNADKSRQNCVNISCKCFTCISNLPQI